MNKKTFVEGHGILVTTKWFRIPMVDTPECALDRRYMLELMGRDPLSQKTISLSKSDTKANKALRNRDGNPICIASYLYPDRVSTDDLKAIHNLVVQAVASDDIKDEGFAADLALRTIVESYIEEHIDASSEQRGPSKTDTCTEQGTERPTA